MSRPGEATIVAIATPAGYGGIGIVRLSGPRSLDLARRLLPNDLMAVEPQPNAVRLAQLINPETGLTIDEALITYFKSPKSFTGEDIVELSCHGSPVVLAEVVRILSSNGAELAQPGEFTLRAFLNRRIDLTQAEAINDLVHAQTASQAQLAVRQLRGDLSTQLAPLKKTLVDLIVHLESAVEFVEDDLDPLSRDRCLSRISGLIEQITRLLETYRLGRIIRNGVRIALVGPPNVGKSSLFNRLLGRERAIVTHLPGTTRDTLNESVSVGGIPVELIDTAGIRESEDLVEQIGVARTRSAIVDADLVIGVVDASEPDAVAKLVADSDRHLMSIVVINKCDLGMVVAEEAVEAAAPGCPVIKASALSGEGVDDLRRSIHALLTAGSAQALESAIITNERHYRALEQSLAAIEKARTDLEAGFTEEIVLESLHLTLRSLGVITGETLISDILDQIFSTFCIGK
jgi:tRNA modification GTPase